MNTDPNLSPAERSAVRIAVSDWLAHLACSGQRVVQTHDAAKKAVDTLVTAGLVPPRSDGSEYSRLNLDPKELVTHGVPQHVVDLIMQTLWDFCVQGILAPAPESSLLDLRFVIFTPYGRAVLTAAGDRVRVHDPDGYLATFHSTQPQPDVEMMRYLEEAVHVFRSGHLLATVVLVGIASERIVEVLASALRDALGTSHGGPNWFNKYKKERDISDRFDALERKLIGEYATELAASRLKQPFERNVRATFEAIRSARNEIAHPNGRDFTWNEAGGYLHLFVDYFRNINSVIAFLHDHARL